MKRDSRTREAAIIAIVSVAVLAFSAAMSAMTGTMSGSAYAGAPVAPGMLGIGERHTAPLVSPVTAEDKVAAVAEQADGALTLLVTPVRKAHVKPAAKPKPKAVANAAVKKPVAKKASRSHVPRAVVRKGAKLAKASVRTWKSARVSWYGPGFYGKRTANGTVLRPDSMICAHRSLPFGTRVQFWFNGRVVTATVADRGPYGVSREFDLGPGTAKALGFSGVGTVRYRIL